MIPEHKRVRARGRTGPAALAGAALAAGLVLGPAPAALAAPNTAVPAATAAVGTGGKAIPAALQKLYTDEADASARARQSGHGVTVAAETGTGTQVTANADGSFTLTEDSAPVRTLRNGAWVPIDTRLSVGAGGRIAPGATTTGLSFSAGGTGPMVVLTQGSDTLALNWPGSLPKPVLSGDTATYAGVYPGVDLQLVADASGFSELLVVHDAQAAADPAVRNIKLGVKATGLTVSDTADGGAQAVDRQGATIFHTDTAGMWDNASTHGPAAAAAKAPMQPAAGARHTARIGVQATNASLTITPDPSMFAATTTRWPVTIDPAWSGNPSQMDWARISSNGWNIYNSTSTASTDHPREGYDNWSGGAGEIARTYYQMNTGGSTGTSGIGGSTVTAATLYVNNDWASSSSATPVDAWLDCGVSGWNSTGLNWSNKPCEQTKENEQTSYESLGSTDSVHPGTLDFNILGAAQLAASKDMSALTFELRSPDESNDLQWKQFASGGGASISVTYYRNPILVNGTGNPVTSPSTVSNGMTYTSSASPTLKITGQDTDGETVRCGYEIWNWNTSTNAATTVVVAGKFSPYTASCGPVTYTGALANGVYAWRGSVENPTGLWSPWSGWQVFTVDTTTPSPPTVESAQFPYGSYGGAYGNQGTFTISAAGSDQIKGYLFSYDGDLGTTVYGGTGVTTWTAGTTPKAGTPYWVPATTTPNGYGSVAFAPGTVGPHRLFAKAVDMANNTGNETSYLFFAGLTTPSYAYGDQLVNGYTANGTQVPAGSATVSDQAVLGVQANCCGTQFADGSQAFLKNGSGAVAVGDTATLHFEVPTSGYYDLGANLTQANDYGTYSLTLDQGTSTPAMLTGGYDAYNPSVIITYHDFGVPKSSAGAPIELTSGVHTLTLAVTGKDTAATGYQAGIDVLRIAPMSATCAINNLTACQNNTAISQNTDTNAADADGWGSSLSATYLAAAGWNAGTPITIDGAPMTVPAYTTGKADNITASGQLITVPSTGVPNDGAAVVFLAFGTNGPTSGISGSITYASGCGGSNVQDYMLDTVPDWVASPADQAAVTFPGRNQENNTQDNSKPVHLYAISVPLACPGQAISSISLPVVSDGVTQSNAAVHILGVGIRPTSFTDATNTQNWTASFADRQEAHLGGLAAAQSVRMPVHISVSGTEVRVHLSNALGTVPASFDHVSIAVQSSGAVPTAAPVPVTFGGNDALSLPAGGDATSDPIAFTTTPGEVLLVSVDLASASSDAVGHANAMVSTWTAAAGTDETEDTTGTPYTGSTGTAQSSYYWLSGVDVSSSGNQAGTLALFGDQSINSDTVSSNTLSTTPDQLIGDLATANAGSVPYGVVDLGSNGWSLANNELPVSSSAAPISALGPIDRTVLAQANVRTVLISEGTSDILNGASANTVETELAALSSEIRAYTSDTFSNNPNGMITVYVATIPPSTAFTAAEEQVREAVNQYILGASGAYLNGNADGVIDFASAVAASGTDTGSTVNSAYLYKEADGTYQPSNSYYAALATAYVHGSAPGSGTVGIGPD